MLTRNNIPVACKIISVVISLQDIASILSSIEERLRVLDTVSAVQAKQARRLDIIQDKLGEHFNLGIFIRE